MPSIGGPELIFVLVIVLIVFAAVALLLAAMVGVESAWRPWRIGSKGEVGLLQVRPNLHGASAAELTDPATNVRVAARLLHSLIERHGPHEAIRRYNGSGHATEGYLRRVLREHGRLAAV